MDELDLDLDAASASASATSEDARADALLDSLEISTGHVQSRQVVDSGALAEAVSAIPTTIFPSSADPDAPTPCAFITGKAGVGKSTLLRERCSANPRYAILAASTGIAAINLNTVTIHSMLGFFDTDSLRDAYIQGKAQRRLRKVADEGYENVVVDECSMISKDVLDILVPVFDDVNGQRKGEGKDAMGLILCGDLCQLPAIPDEPQGHGYHHAPGRRRTALPTPWCFESQFWPRFAANTIHLTKVWRQADSRFLAALDFARSGRGRDCVQVLQSCGQRFEFGVDMKFQGTTVVGKNDEVDRLNQMRLDQEPGRRIELPTRRWSADNKGRPEWKNIPERTILRENCYVMILANQYVEGQMVYANGDCGWVRGIQPPAGGNPGVVLVELVRTGEVVTVGPLVRDISFGDKPEHIVAAWPEQNADRDGSYLPEPHYRKQKRRWVIGQLAYYPLRLAYASTCHKVQGLSLDRVQIDFRTWNWGKPGMVYVGMSRARSLEGLRLVGSAEAMVKHCKVDAKVVRWL